MVKRGIIYLQVKMAEEKQEAKKQEKPKQAVPKKEVRTLDKDIASASKIIRILQTDIPGNKNIYAGLTRIKGVSWAISNALCILHGFDKTRKIENLSKEEIEKIENILKEGKFPQFLLNRKKDFETGEDKHLITNDLDLAKELDIKRLKKIRSYRGLRHATGQPTRGQKTRSHFRENRKKGVGIKNKKATMREK